ncbi:MAG: 4'-phosphopantetheinyl transferase superfamily protein [Candidatus Heimdallarchaeota archaeon]|nr:MAG: 4'-phosphopantetheinyl transferase superfamily protein [Candidatus Heimdallarchaeota archaeon]
MTRCYIGVDVVEIQRFRILPPSKHPRFYKRVFDKYEFKHCIGRSDPFPHFAGIFAAKEAVFKAINDILPLQFTQISIRYDINGRPIVWINEAEFSAQLEKYWKNQNLEVQVSIAHSSDLAVAWAITFSTNSGYDLVEGFNKFKTELQREVNDVFVEHRCVQ